MEDLIILVFIEAGKGNTDQVHSSFVDLNHELIAETAEDSDSSFHLFVTLPSCLLISHNLFGNDLLRLIVGDPLTVVILLQRPVRKRICILHHKLGQVPNQLYANVVLGALVR